MTADTSGKKSRVYKKNGQGRLALKNNGPLYSYPMGIWFLVFFVAPILIILVFSFMKQDYYGGVIKEFSIEAYKQVFSPMYGKVYLRIIIPFWTNSMIRIFAWMSILETNGFLHNILISIGLMPENSKLLYNQGAVILVMIYMFLPYAILPIFSSIDKFDFSLLEAARDLGATKAQSMFKVLLPEIQSGILTAFIFTFIPIFGSYTVPDLIGGKDDTVLGTVIVNQVMHSRNMPVASAFSVVITLVSTVGVVLMLYSSRRQKMDMLSKKRNG